MSLPAAIRPANGKPKAAIATASVRWKNDRLRAIRSDSSNVFGCTRKAREREKGREDGATIGAWWQEKDKGERHS